jgi:SHS2 domain-containing protein
MKVPISGFKELEHTADWALKVWAPELSTLFVEAVRGMNILGGIELKKGSRISRSFSLESDSVESLLVMFLEEILFYGEDEGVGFDEYEIIIAKEYHLKADIHGGTIGKQQKEIKAVTFHNLNVAETESGYEVVIVFDV